ncbi:MAG: response regulator [Desulfovibrionaceae bacterium]
MHFDAHLFLAHELWLMERVLGYAKRQGYTVYTSTLVEAWRTSVAGLTGALVEALERWGDQAPEFSPEVDAGNNDDPVVRFAMLEARRHRERGISLGMFLGLLKYYRQAYADLVLEKIKNRSRQEKGQQFVLRFFDILEVALCAEWAASSQDVKLSELQAKNREMTNEKNKYLTLFESLGAPVLLLDQEQRVENLNCAAATLVGFSTVPGAAYYSASSSGPEVQTNGAEWHRGMPLDDLPDWLSEPVRRYIASGDETWDERVRLESGEVQAWYQMHCTRMLDVSGKFDGNIVVLEDITAQVSNAEYLAKARENLEHLVQQRSEELWQANRRLEESEVRYRDLIHHLQEGIWLVDASAETTFVNPRLAEMLGYQAGEMLGRPMDGFVIPEMRESCRELLRNRRKESRKQRELELLCKGGRRVVVAMSSCPVLDAEEKYAGALAAVTDITDRKRGENELREARDQAEAANLAKTQFLANMSHELRTPLNGIMGMTQLMLETEPSGEQRELLELCLDSSQRLLGVISDLLELSTIEAGRIKLRRDAFALHDCLEPLMKSFQVQARLKGLALQWEVDEDVPENLVGDDGRIRQVLVNIIGNAVKFTEQGGLSVRVRRVAGNGGGKVWLRFSVRDSGIGIPEEHLQNIFESFTLGEDYMTKRYGGSGLGLAISRQLVEMMGGVIEVRSEVGQGSDFHVTLPLIQTTVDIRDLRRKAEEQGQAQAVDGLRILLAEDELVNQTITARMLTRAGHSVAVAQNGIEAMQMLEAARFDLVLMDLQMPRMNGLEATQRIRAGELPGVDPNIPIIACTAYAGTSDRKRCLDAGMDDYLAKPFEAAELLKKVERYSAQPEASPEERAGTG